MTICAYIFSFCYNCVCNVHVPIPRAMAFGTVINVARESIATLKSSVIYDISLKVKLQFIQLWTKVLAEVDRKFPPPIQKSKMENKCVFDGETERGNWAQPFMIGLPGYGTDNFVYFL